MRILLANEPGTCRDALAGAIRMLLDDIEVIDMSADELDTGASYLAPDLVICSRMSEVIDTRTRTWILLYPRGEHRVEVGVAGTRRWYEDLALDGILDVIRVERARKRSHDALPPFLTCPTPRDGAADLN